MNNPIKNRLAQVAAIIVILATLVYAIIIPSLWQSLTIVIGSFFVLVSPGLTLTYAFYPNVSAGKDNSSENTTKIDYIERATLSILLSMALVPIALFIAHHSGVVLTIRNVAVLVVAVNILTTASAVIIPKLTSK